jgi:hypothetical protein
MFVLLVLFIGVPAVVWISAFASMDRALGQRAWALTQ